MLFSRSSSAPTVQVIDTGLSTSRPWKSASVNCRFRRADMHRSMASRMVVLQLSPGPMRQLIPFLGCHFSVLIPRKFSISTSRIRAIANPSGSECYQVSAIGCTFQSGRGCRRWTAPSGLGQVPQPWPKGGTFDLELVTTTTAGEDDSEDLPSSQYLAAV